MKAARVTVPVATALILMTGSAVAAPQSMLDPYANIKAPTTKAKLAQTAPKLAKETKSQKLDDDIPPPKATKTTKATKVIAPAPTASESGGGFLTGTKQVFHGMGTATKGAAADVINPVKSLGSGVVSGGKKVSSTLAGGAKTATTAVKDGTVAVSKAVTAAPKKVGEGLKSTGEKLKDGTVAAGKAVSAAPKAVGKGIMGAASKTGEISKKAAIAPFHLAAKLNPFRHKEAAAVASKSESVQK